MWVLVRPPRRGGSNEYPQSMFLSRNKANNVYPCEPQFYYIKVRFKGVKIIKVCFRDAKSASDCMDAHVDLCLLGIHLIMSNITHLPC